MKSITNKGIVSTDAVIALLAVLLMIFLMINSLNETIIKNKETKNLFYLKSKAVFFADSLIKNSNEINPEKGIAFYNKEKKRVEENKIDLTLLKKIRKEKFTEYLKEIKLEFGEEKIQIGKKEGSCFEARRFILTEKKEKGVIFVSACN